MKSRIEVQVRNGKDITSQPMEQGQAEVDLAKISSAQQSSEFCKLDWLSLHGADILSANLKPHHPPMAATLESGPSIKNEPF